MIPLVEMQKIINLEGLKSIQELFSNQKKDWIEGIMNDIWRSLNGIEPFEVIGDALNDAEPENIDDAYNEIEVQLSMVQTKILLLMSHLEKMPGFAKEPIIKVQKDIDRISDYLATQKPILCNPTYDAEDFDPENIEHEGVPLDEDYFEAMKSVFDVDESYYKTHFLVLDELISSVKKDKQLEMILDWIPGELEKLQAEIKAVDALTKTPALSAIRAIYEEEATYLKALENQISLRYKKASSTRELTDADLQLQTRIYNLKRDYDLYDLVTEVSNLYKEGGDKEKAKIQAEVILSTLIELQSLKIISNKSRYDDLLLKIDSESFWKDFGAMFHHYNGSSAEFLNMLKIPDNVSQKEKKSVQSDNVKLVSKLESKLKSLISVKRVSGTSSLSQEIEMENLSSKISVYKKAQKFYNHKKVGSGFFSQPAITKPEVSKKSSEVFYLTKEGAMLNVKPSEWATAEALFKSEKYKGKNKISYKDDNALNHSFMIFGEKMLAISKEKHDSYAVRGGGFGRVKLGQEKNGKNYIVKMEILHKNRPTVEGTTEMQVEKKLNRFHGSATRTSHSNKLQDHYRKRVDVEGGYTKGYALIEVQSGADIERGFQVTGELEKNGLLMKAAIGSAECLLGFHKLGYVHRDIKPNNYIMSLTGEVVLVDFGLTKIYRLESGEDDFSVDAPRGTPGYMAPELYEEDPQHTLASDVYSLGVMLNKEFGIDIPEMIDPIADKRPPLEEIIGYLIILDRGSEKDLPASFAAWHLLGKEGQDSLLDELSESPSKDSTSTKKSR